LQKPRSTPPEPIPKDQNHCGAIVFHKDARVHCAVLKQPTIPHSAGPIRTPASHGPQSNQPTPNPDHHPAGEPTTRRPEPGACCLRTQQCAHRSEPITPATFHTHAHHSQSSKTRAVLATSTTGTDLVNVPPLSNHPARMRRRRGATHGHPLRRADDHELAAP
jgi:hypothetical protein